MKRSKKGFTLAELLVVVAIIAILVAIAIPVFTAATDKAKEAVEVANARSVYAEGISQVVMDPKTDISGTTIQHTYDGTKYTFTYTANTSTWTVKLEPAGTNTFTGNINNGFPDIDIDGKPAA